MKSIVEQGKLTDALAGQIQSADSKTTLEDLYLPYKPKRRTRAQIAREAGLEPLADLLFDDPTKTPETEAEAFVDTDKGVEDVKAALDGARHILIERFSEDAALLGKLRDYFSDHASIQSEVVPGKENEGAKYRDYFEFSEAVSKVPSHRVMALFRARTEGILSVKVDILVDEEGPAVKHPCEVMIAKRSLGKILAHVSRNLSTM